MSRTDQIPRQHVYAQLRQARPARPASPLHSCAPSLSGAHMPTRHELTPIQHPSIQHCDANREKNPIQSLTRTSVGSSPKLRSSLTIRRVTSNAQHDENTPAKQQTSSAKNMLGQSLSPYVPERIVQGAPAQRVAQHFGPSCTPCHNLYRVMSPDKA
jgi:hypothetical protein